MPRTRTHNATTMTPRAPPTRSIVRGVGTGGTCGRGARGARPRAADAFAGALAAPLFADPLSMDTFGSLTPRSVRGQLECPGCSSPFVTVRGQRQPAERI